ncbi:MAG: membrane protein FxsA [Candidatus Omnitrophica bacterium]|nr:membrane protein FxsA [Candidatus Omnitrophota bacterium]
MGYLILLFTVLPALELALLIKVGSHIGALNTIALVILTGGVGAAVARHEGFRVLMKIQDSLQQGVMPSAELLDGMMILAGGVALLTPGFITDVLGLLLLFPVTRAGIKWLLQRKFESMIKQGQVVHFSSFGAKSRRFDGYNDIDVG